MPSIDNDRSNAKHVIEIINIYFRKENYFFDSIATIFYDELYRSNGTFIICKPL